MTTFDTAYCGDCIPIYQYKMWFFIENSSNNSITANFDSITPSLAFSNYALVNSITNNQSSFLLSTYPGGNVTIPAGSTLTVRGPSVGNEALQISSAPLLNISGQTLNFWFWSDDTAPTQYINLIAENGFSTTVNTSSQNTVIGNGVQVGLGGCGAAPATINICIQVSSYTSSTDNFFVVDPSLPAPVPEGSGLGLLPFAPDHGQKLIVVPEGSSLGLLLLGIATLTLWRRRSDARRRSLFARP